MLKRVERQVQAPVQALLVRLLGSEARATKKSVFQLNLPHFILQARSCCNEHTVPLMWISHLQSARERPDAGRGKHLARMPECGSPARI